MPLFFPGKGWQLTCVQHTRRLTCVEHMNYYLRASYYCAAHVVLATHVQCTKYSSHSICLTYELVNVSTQLSYQNTILKHN